MKSSKIVFLLFFFLFQGCNHDSTDYRDQIQVSCRDNDAIIIRCSRFVANGEAYYLGRDIDGWTIEQKIDLKPYLKGWSIEYLGDIDRSQGKHVKRSVQYNGKWLCILLKRGSPGSGSYSKYSRQARVLVFKKKDSKWKYYSTVSSSRRYFSATSIVLINDYLFVNNPYKKTGNKYGVVYCYCLNERKPKLLQSIIPPVNNGDIQDGDGINLPYSIAVNDMLIVPWAYGDQVVHLQESADRDFPTDYVAIYGFVDGRWTLKGKLDDRHIRGINKIESYDNKVIFYLWRGYFPRLFSFDDNKFGHCIFKASAEKGKEPDYYESHGYRAPFGYNIISYEKDMTLGIIKPSQEDSFQVVEPDWSMPSGNPETMKMMTDYYKSLKSYHGFSKSYLKDRGYSSYYELTDYIPTVDFATCGSTLVTSYVFDECYFEGSPLQKAKVWAGINVYEIDPEQGPKRVLALTTSNLGELKVVP